VARWNGQTTGPHAFSVAQHCLVVEELVRKLAPETEPRWRLAALLHDAPEYVIGDMISPFKAALGLDYRAFEDRLERAIHIRFGLPPRTPAEIKRLIKTADRISAHFEAIELAGFGEAEANLVFGRPPKGVRLKLEPMPAAEAEAKFLERFARLSKVLDRTGARPAGTPGG
jgi:hypothetical protein